MTRTGNLCIGIVLLSALIAIPQIARSGDVFNMSPGLTSLEMVTIDDVGNASDSDYSGDFGAVDYIYSIGKFEVISAQYTEFLNAVAKTDTYGLYNELMWSDSNSYGCKIERTGSSGSYSYSVAADQANRPVNYVSWGDTVRFANWLQNGQPTGGQDLSTTEDGSYYLNGAMTEAELAAVTRRVDAVWVLPSEDEWYKAAYYDGDADVYYDFATGTDSIPSNQLLDPDPGNSANYDSSTLGYTLGTPYYRTEVGAFENSASPYGIFDQSGNVAEWNEGDVYSTFRCLRGGGWGYTAVGNIHDLYSSRRTGYTPTYETTSRSGIIGFRVAQIPEPAAIALLSCGVVGLLRRRRRV